MKSRSRNQIINKTNFSFAKAAAELKNAQDNYLGRMGKDVVEEAKYRIENSKFPGDKPLSDFTKEMRRKGKYWGNKSGNRYKTNSTKPLVHTGRLLNSIKTKKKGISIVKYAKYHNDGWVSGGRWTGKIGPREFLVYDEKDAISKAKKGFKANKKAFVREIDENMKTKL